ncbi:hypothetical protein GCM10010923_06320 [Blastomonas marina]|uniref:Ancillary SecYEG translocon subunit/Cell division coordinator CpoB TPR domain-containing protein n=1 Tax=Blastomonas marina TaxID=1867408 RepID=A0ABQ1F650_9SPHN|nr:tetratricopeptide repeat protein [Blastomonas marina]GGA00431.1 hypothetical protein GCM10010923_06320 [Blastomonas marina]
MALPPNDKNSAPQPTDKKAARESAEQDGFMREVDEALREQQMQDAARKYGLPIGIALVVIIAGVGGWLWWDGRQTAEDADRGERLTMALDRIEKGNAASADEMLTQLAGEDDANATAALARMTQAALLLEDGKAEEAAKIYSAVAADDDVPQQLRDLATVREVAARFDELPPAQVVERLKPLAVAGNPWFGSAGELVAMAYLKQGKEDLAGPLLAEVSRDEDVPQTIRRRTRQMAGLLGVDAVDDVERTLNESELAARGQTAPAPAPQQ